MRRRVRGLGIAGAAGIVGMVMALVAAVLLRGVWVAHGAPGRTHTPPHTVSAPAIASESCTLSQWTVVSTPNTPGGVLRATAAASGSDVWAAGYYDDAALQANQTLIEHWNGTAWNVIPSPNASAGDNQLYGVAALATNDVWVVGYYVNSSNAPLTLIEHWDGSQWSVVPSPNPGGTDANGYLAAVSAVSATDIWAVGFYLDDTVSNFRTLSEHWDGTQWSIMPSANPGAFPNELLGVATISADDVWAVGFYDDVNDFDGALMEHWDGKSWTAVASPPVGILQAVTAISTNDIWAVGNDGLTIHWNGVQWSVVPSATVGNSSVTFQAVAAISANDVWAIGNSLQGSSSTLTEHWNGSQWSVVPITGASSLYGLAAISASDVWVVGASSTGGTIIEHYRRILPRLPGTASRTGSHSPGGAILCP